MTLPTAGKPQQGIFVYRRLQAMSRRLSVRALRPQPWFPWLRGDRLDPPPHGLDFPMDGRRMLYLPGIAKSFDGRWMERCILRWIDSVKPDPQFTLLDAHFAYPEGVAVHRAAKRLGLPFIVTLRGVEEEWLRLPRVRSQISRALQDASGVIAVSESMRTAAAGVGMDPERIRVIGNGCDRAVFYPGCQRTARGKLGISERTTLLASVANIKHVKGHDVLVDALSRLPSSMDFEWICIGAEEQPEFAERVRQQINDAGLTTRVRFIGPRSPAEIADYLRAADAFVLASRREGCCNAILEAMACGTPVVATAVGDHLSLAQRFAGIRVADSEDPTAFCEMLSATLQGQVTMPESDGLQFEPRSWDEVADDCIDVIRTATSNGDGWGVK